MTERIHDVKVVEVEFMCPCGEPMVATGFALRGEPSQYLHQCANGHTRILRNLYPYIRHERIAA